LHTHLIRHIDYGGIYYGFVAKISLRSIPSEFISFIYGDSMAVPNRNDKITIMTKEMLSKSIRDFKGTIDEYMEEIAERYYYIEVQLWNDDYCCTVPYK
jgi:hypothetical protein